MLNLLDDEILKFSYAAEIAGLTGSVSSFKEGIVINASGYNDKLHVLLEDILKTIKSIEIKEANFNIWKERTIRSYRNHSFGVPYSQSNSHFTYLLNETTWTLEEKETALAGVTFEDLVEHSKKFLQYGRIEVGAFGNLSKKDALQIADSTIEILKPLPLSPSEDVALRSYFLPESALYNYTIKLKDNLKWANGDPLTAKDYVFAWRRLFAPETAAQSASTFFNIKNAKAINEGTKDPSELGVEAVSDTELKVTLEYPDTYFTSSLSSVNLFPQNEAFATSKGEAYGTTSENTLGNGPFVLKDWDGTGLTWNYQRNENYWAKDNIKLNKICLMFKICDYYKVKTNFTLNIKKMP